MNLGLVTLAALLAGGTGQPDPFDQYLSHIGHRDSDSDWREFSKSCLGEAASSEPIRAVMRGSRWSKTSDIGAAYKRVDSDFFDSVEVWGPRGKPRALVLWSLTLDVGSEVRTFVCLNDRGSLTKVRVTNWSFSVDGGQQEWKHELLEEFGAGGTVIAKRSYFEDVRGNETRMPPAADGVDGFDAAPTQKAISKILSELGQSAINKQGTR